MFHFIPPIRSIEDYQKSAVKSIEVEPNQGPSYLKIKIFLKMIITFSGQLN